MTISTSLIREFANFSRANDLFPWKGKLLVAVSGGVDSMVLLDIMLELKYELGLELAVVHVNHQLRGNESEGDEEFVRQTTARSRLPFFCKRVNILELKHALGVSKQVAARQARYQFFEEIRQETNSDCVATGHQADDNAETVLFNALRGTGIRGLAGIPVTRSWGRVVRPLLFARKKDILAYASEKEIRFRNDSSNESVVYSRNYLRHSVVPLLTEEFGSDAVDVLNRISNVTRNFGCLLDRFVDERLPFTVRFSPDQCEISLPSFSNEPRFVKEEMVLRVFRHLNVEPSSIKVNEVLGLGSKQAGHRINLSARMRVRKERDRLVFCEEHESRDFAVSVSLGKTYFFDRFMISLGEPGPVPLSFARDGSTEYVDGDKIRHPLTVRNWKAGDWFVPLGMKGRKKLSDFFNDRKVSPLEKTNAPVLASEEGIVWVCGRRIDERYRITGATRKAIKLSFSPTAHPVN